MPGRGELARLAPRPLPLGAGAHASALDAVSLDVWQHCAFSSLLGHREVCALMCVSRGLAQLMANERIWRSLFLAAMNTPALSDVAHWRSAFKQRCAPRAPPPRDPSPRARAHPPGSPAGAPPAPPFRRAARSRARAGAWTRWCARA